MIDREVLGKVAEQMVREAESKGITGTALVGLSFMQDGVERIEIGGAASKLTREPDPNRLEDIGTNYGGFAAGKLFQSIRTGLESVAGNDIRKGESPARGALVLTMDGENKLVIGFSGGTEKQDVQLAEAGAKFLLRHLVFV